MASARIGSGGWRSAARNGAFAGLAGVLALTGCSTGQGVDDAARTPEPLAVTADRSDVPPTDRPSVPSSGGTEGEVVAGPGSVVTSLGEPLPSALGVPAVEERSAPVSISIPELDLSGVTIQPVGVEPDGVMEVPPADQVGWYRYGPTPGDDEGSAVLAGHVASPLGDGAFRDLGSLEPGDLVEVDVEGERRRFTVVEIDLIAKPDVPFEDLFARTGSPTLVLVTCGGDWNADRRSYESNVVVTAVPLPTS